MLPPLIKSHCQQQTLELSKELPGEPEGNKGESVRIGLSGSEIRFGVEMDVS